MFRLIGFLGGAIMFLILAVKEIPGFPYYYVASIVSFGFITFVIIFRIMAKYLNGFWKIWCLRFQKWILQTLLCLSKYSYLPDY